MNSSDFGSLPKASRLGLVLVLALLLGGCVGSQQLTTANQQLTKTAGDAKTYALGLKAAIDAQDTALASARTAMGALVTGANQTIRAKAVVTVDAAYYKATDDLNRAYAGLLGNWLDTTQSTFATLDDSLKKALGPMEIARSTALSKYRDAKKLSDEYPNDATRRETAQKLLAIYLTESALVYEQEDRARVSVSDSWIQSDKDFRQQIAATLATKQAELDKIRADSLAKIAAVPAKATDLGPDAGKLAAGMDPLIQFSDATQQTAKANLLYFQLYAFGKDSLFADFIGSLGSGFIKGLPMIGSRQAPTWADVATAAEQVASDQKAVIAKAGSDATATLNQAGTTFIKQIVSAFDAKIPALITKTSGVTAPTSPTTNP